MKTREVNKRKRLALEKHVNGHFNSDGTQNTNPKKSVENSSAKLFKRNGKKIRFRRQPWSARMFDFMDAGIMEGLQYRLLAMTEKRTLGQFESSAGNSVTLRSEVVARRVEPDGTAMLLLRWHPTDIVEDEWISLKDYSRTKVVAIPTLQPVAKSVLKPLLFSTAAQYHQPQSIVSQQAPPNQKWRNRRKPCKIT